MYWAIVVLKR